MSPRFPADLRPASAFACYHRRVRERAPWLQTVVLIALIPILYLRARIRVEGRENIPDGGYVVAANHPSVLDPFFVALAVRRRIRFMGKSDLFTARWGRLLARLGGFPVRRGVWDTDAFETAEQTVRHGRVVAMFPEGGVSAAGGDREPRPGIGQVAHRTGATVVPLHITGTRDLYRPWTRPRIRIAIGQPLRVEHDRAPTRERNRRTAEQILAAVVRQGGGRAYSA